MPNQIKNFPSFVADQDVWNFSVDADGLYLVTITARCKNWLQNFRRRFNDDDLAVQIDDYFFGELSGKKREFNIIGSWNGNELKNTSKAVIFLVPLKASEHKITFWTDQSPLVETIEVVPVALGAKKFIVPVPGGVSAVDLVFKNVVPENIIATNLLGVDKPINMGSVWSTGIRLVNVLKPRDLSAKSLAVTITDASIRYRIGLVKLYGDITKLPTVNLFTDSKSTAPSLATLSDGAEVEIVEERVQDEMVAEKSDIWHKIRYQDLTGFALSSFIEIQGQERDKIIDLIKAKCSEPEPVPKSKSEPKMKVDPNIMLSIAGIESHFKPYAVSSRGAAGIFQLTGATAEDLGVTDRFDFVKNIDGGVRYFRKLSKKYTKRGNVFEKRLVAWQSGPGYVSDSAPVNYSILPYPAEARKFVKRVPENMVKKDWHSIILLLLAIGIGNAAFLAGQFTAIHPVIGSTSTVVSCSADGRGQDNIKSGADTVDSAVFRSHGDGSPALIIVKDISASLFDEQTEFFYCDKNISASQTLLGSFVSAGWVDTAYASNKVFWVERSEGHYLPTTFFHFNYSGDRRFTKIKFITKDGRVSDSVSAPFDILSANGESVLREWVDSAPNNDTVTRVREYKYDFRANIFRETNIVKRVLPPS